MSNIFLLPPPIPLDFWMRPANDTKGEEIKTVEENKGMIVKRKFNFIKLYTIAWINYVIPSIFLVPREKLNNREAKQEVQLYSTIILLGLKKLIDVTLKFNYRVPLI